MTDSPNSVALIITTYNWPEALELVLNSVLEQSRLPDEVIIADDGSREETRNLIDSFISDNPRVNIIHVWQEDNGFRLAEIRNKAIAIVQSEYLIQIDGDIILNKFFVEDHLSKAKANTFNVGSRVLLSERVTKDILNNKEFSFGLFSDDVVNKGNSIRLPFLSSIFDSPSNDVGKAVTSIRGCNMAFWTKDLVEVNGYNQDMTGWGREDSELAARLMNKGVKKAKIKFMAIQFHLHHNENDRSKFDINHEILMKTIEDKLIVCRNGIVRK